MYPDPHSRMLEVDHDEEEEHQGIETLIRLAWLFSYVGLRVCHHHNHVHVKDGGGSGSGSSITKEVLLTKHPRESPNLWPRGFESEDPGVMRFARPESSWRKIVMFDDIDDDDIDIDDDDMDDIDDDENDENDQHKHVTRRRRIGNVQVEVWVVKSNKNTTPSYVQTWNFHRKEKPTLGDVYDGLKILYGRTQEQHAKIAEQEQQQQEQEQQES